MQVDAAFFVLFKKKLFKAILDQKKKKKLESKVELHPIKYTRYTHTEEKYSALYINS